MLQAKEDLNTLEHDEYKKRVTDLLNIAQQWVLFYRKDIITRGHNTNNFAEASIRILKDIVLSRTKAFNAVALTEFVAIIWEEYFQQRILKHAHNRCSSATILYDRLLKRIPEEQSSAVRPISVCIFEVPSFTDREMTYHVNSDIGVCNCFAGMQGAFCKHQALVHSRYGGMFPNAPALSSADRYKLGILALGDKCPPPSFFAGLHDTMLSDVGSSSGDVLEEISGSINGLEGHHNDSHDGTSTSLQRLPTVGIMPSPRESLLHHHNIFAVLTHIRSNASQGKIVQNYTPKVRFYMPCCYEQAIL